MNFNCDACQKLYSIADEKVQGRSFRVTCKQCGHVIVVKGGGQGSAQPSPARTPATPTPTPTAPAPATPPATEPPPAPALPPLSGDEPPADRPDEHEHFFQSEPAHRPRVTAERLVQNRRRHPLRLVTAIGLALVLVAGGVALTMWRTEPKRVDPPPAPLAARKAVEPAPAPAPAPALVPAPAVKAQVPPEPTAAEPPPEPPLPHMDALAPKGVGGRAGFEPVGGSDGDDPRDRLRKQGLTIAKKDKKLLDLLGKKGDAAPALVARTELDTGRGSLDEVAVRQTLAANANGFAACVTRAVKADPHLKVNDRRATLNLTVKPSGMVSSAWISEADLDKSLLGRCLLSTARRMVFPAFSGEEIEVAAPLSLSTTY